MKTIKLMTLGIMMFFASNAMNAQVSINVNLGLQPSWGPVGYSSVDYYYLPDIQAYYDVRATQFIFLNGGVWIRSGHLPRQYRDYDLNRGYKVVLNDYHGARPYDEFRYHKVKYYKGYRGAPQKSIGYAYRNDHDNGNHNGEYKRYGGGKHENHGRGNKHGH